MSDNEALDASDSAAAYSAERLSRYRKAAKLIEALRSEHEDLGADGDHEWRRCRACHARNELDHRAARDLLGLVLEVMQERTDIQADFADWLADREGNLYEQVQDLIEQFDAERKTHAEFASAVSAAVDSAGLCFDGRVDGVQAIANRLNEVERRWHKLLDALGSEWEEVEMTPPSADAIAKEIAAEVQDAMLREVRIDAVEKLRPTAVGYSPDGFVVVECNVCHATHKTETHRDVKSPHGASGGPA